MTLFCKLNSAERRCNTIKTIKIIVYSLIITLFLAAPASADPRYDLQVEIYKKVIDFPYERPYTDTFADRSFLPLRHVAQILGAEVSWDEAAGTATVRYGQQDFLMEAGAKTVMVNNEEKILNGRAEIAGNHMMVPADFFSKVLGLDMYWDYGTRTVIIF